MQRQSKVSEIGFFKFSTFAVIQDTSVHSPSCCNGIDVFQCHLSCETLIRFLVLLMLAFVLNLVNRILLLVALLLPTLRTTYLFAVHISCVIKQ